MFPPMVNHKIIDSSNEGGILVDHLVLNDLAQLLCFVQEETEAWKRTYPKKSLSDRWGHPWEQKPRLLSPILSPSLFLLSLCEVCLCYISVFLTFRLSLCSPSPRPVTSFLSTSVSPDSFSSSLCDQVKLMLSFFSLPFSGES